MGTHEMSAHLTGTASETRQIVDGATAAKRPLTQSEIDSITRALQRMQGLLQRHRDKIDVARREAADFVRLVSADYGKLTTSAERLDGAIGWIDNWVVTVLPSYIRDIHMMNMAAEYAAAWRRKLVTANDAVHVLATANDKAQSALPAIVAAWATVDGKFKAVITTLGNAAKAAATAGNVPLMLDVASRSWQDFLRYIGTTVSAAALVA